MIDIFELLEIFLLDLAGRVWEIWGVVWWENVCSLFNNSGRQYGTIENRDGKEIGSVGGFGLLGWYNIFINGIKGVKCKRRLISFIFNGHQSQKEVNQMARLTKANRALLEQNLRELNRELARARKERDEESIVILEAQVNSTIRELDK